MLLLFVVYADFGTHFFNQTPFIPMGSHLLCKSLRLYPCLGFTSVLRLSIKYRKLVLTNLNSVKHILCNCVEFSLSSVCSFSSSFFFVTDSFRKNIIQMQGRAPTNMLMPKTPVYPTALKRGPLKK